MAVRHRQSGRHRQDGEGSINGAGVRPSFYMTLQEITQPNKPALYWIIVLRPPFRKRKISLRCVSFDEAKRKAIKIAGPGFCVEDKEDGRFKGPGLAVTFPVNRERLIQLIFK